MYVCMNVWVYAYMRKYVWMEMDDYYIYHYDDVMSDM